ncbi:MAG: M23 family metallopeptidase [Amylibacter sp.]|nr:M23 family metallopeptidase [Amylibacter sp.]
MVNRVILALCLMASPAFSDPIVLAWPIECILNETCFIQQYMDVDDTDGVRDFMGGAVTYDGHKGTDIRLKSRKAMQDGVNVLAASAGQVKGLRDGMVDRLVRTDADRVAIKGKDCGNGVLIAHLGGWETQYCHMKQGSIAVVKGQMVQAGAVLGQVGLSGRTQFPHVHIAVRKDGQKVDPFALDNPLWQDGMVYQPTQIINLGLADGAVKMNDIAMDKFQGFTPGKNAPALVAYVRAINLVKGDQIRLIFTGPAGQIVAKVYDPVDRAKAQQMYFGGKKRPSGGWPVGVYRVEVQVLRGGVVLDSERLEKTAK